MKKFLSTALICILCLTFTFSLTGCFNSADVQPTPTPIPEDIDPATVDVIGETWRVTELSFETTEKYIAAKGEQCELEFFGEFTHKATGKTLTIPGFWDGDNTFKLRFSPTEYGVWEYKTICEADESLAGKTGTIGANVYKGDLEVYKRGFVKTDPTKKYFVYNDGTPFFYIGDTHWSLMREEFDSAGDHAGDIKTDSHFKYICDKRVEQGFTVYQSQPIGASFELTDGTLNRQDLLGFQHADQYFEYIANKGLTHANAQICFPTYAWDLSKNDEALDDLTRYWVARFGAYPVMWTLGQEVDNDFYSERNKQQHITSDNNMYFRIAEYINKYDAYKHPLSAHQEASTHTTITGSGTSEPVISNKGASIFASDEATQKTGHSWWATSAGPDFLSNRRFYTVAKDYWASPKVAVTYEGPYCYLATKDFGARAQGWRAYLNGFFGHGYGAIDIWQYKSTYQTHLHTSDGVDKVLNTEKLKHWSEAIEFESAYQIGYMRQFFEKIEWWKLVPDFDNNVYFTPAVANEYAVATIDNSVYVVYLFNRTRATGYLANMDDKASYTITWFNPRTNEYIELGNDIKTNTTDKNGKPAFQLPNKPESSIEDWVILATKN